MRTLFSAAGLAALVTIGMVALGPVPAMAQSSTGQIGLRGFVASRCGAGGPSGTTSPTFGGTISLGELADAHARLRPALVNSTSGSPAGTIAFQAGCTGTAATVTLSATRLSTTNPVPTGDGGLAVSNDIDYTAQVAMALTGGGITTLNYTTAATLPAPSMLTVGEGFAFIPENLEIRIFGLRPEAGDQSILVAGTYDAVITVTITPA